MASPSSHLVGHCNGHEQISADLYLQKLGMSGRNFAKLRILKFWTQKLGLYLLSLSRLILWQTSMSVREDDWLDDRIHLQHGVGEKGAT